MNILGNNPYGLRPASTYSSSAVNAATLALPLNFNQAQEISEGDLVVFDQTNGGIKGLVAAQLTPLASATAVRPVGVFAGCTYTKLNGELVRSNFWPAGGVATFGASPATAYVYADPFMIFSIQCSTSTGAVANAIAGVSRGAIGRFININYGAGASPLPANAYFSDRTLMSINPGRATSPFGLSTAYADTANSVTGIAPAIANATFSPALLQIVGIDTIPDQMEASAYGAGDISSYAHPAAGVSFANWPGANPPVAGAQQIVDGAFNRILVRINNHAFTGGGYSA